MRTKALLCAATLAAGAVSSMAQSNVYSLNVVGYVNKTFTANNYTLVSNPLDNGTNTLSSIIPTAPATTQVNLWDATIQDFSSTIPVFNAGAWSANPHLPPGAGFFVVAASNFTNTFVGNVLQGSVTNPVPLLGGGNYVCLGNPVPVGGSITNFLAGYVPTATDQVNFWDTTIQDFSSTIPVFGGGVWSHTDYQLPVGDGFFLIRAATTTGSWVQNFTVK